MYAVCKEESTTAKLRVGLMHQLNQVLVFLFDSVLVGLMIHSTQMYSCSFVNIILPLLTLAKLQVSPTDKDLHCFVWYSDAQILVLDYCMTRITFGVSASSFTANMAVWQNVIDFASECPLALTR